MQSFWQAARSAARVGLRENAARPLAEMVPVRQIRTSAQRDLRIHQRISNAGNATARRHNSRITGQSTSSKASSPVWKPGPTTGNRSDTKHLVGAVFGASAVAYLASVISPQKSEEQHDDNEIRNNIDTDTDTESKVSQDLETSTTTFKLAEVSKHNRDSDTKWVVYGTSVYDITEFVGMHPGGEVILRACGGPIDQYWDLFSIHKKNNAIDILKQYYIGEVDSKDLDDSGKVDWTILGPEAGIVDDPFKLEPERDENLIVHTAKPCNAETPGDLLLDFLTPLKLFFVRHHFWVPQGKDVKDSFTIEFSDGEEMSYSLEDLKAKFQEHTITVTLQCSGNRRGHMSKAKQGKTAGLQWGIGAIGTAEFTGVRLRDVMKDAGYCVERDCPTPSQCCDEDADQHVEFVSSDTYAASIPLQKVLNPQGDVLLAYSMNGEPLNQEHGGPIRAIVPGITAARSVKWLDRILISSDECQGQFQKRDYKLFGPNVLQSQATPELWDSAEPIHESPVQSAITKITQAKNAKETKVQGFAFSGGGRKIVRVDVSSDGGKTWRQAELQPDAAKGSKRWCWTLWSMDWPTEDLEASGATEFMVKAVDCSYNQQPADFDYIWNFRGLLATAWHKMPISGA